MFLTALLWAAVGGVSPTPDEMGERDRWVGSKLLGASRVAPPPGTLTVLANNDPVQKNARTGRALNIAGRRFRRGLFAHARSEIVVRLPGPGRAFEALVGVDTNEQTRGGRGSVVFSVTVGGKEAFRSPILREGMPAVPVRVDLDGARSFRLAVGDAGDGIACDQADWAEARVTLGRVAPSAGAAGPGRAGGGRTLWLGDMAMEDPHRPVPDSAPPFSFSYAGRPSTAFLASWRLARTSRRPGGRRTEHVLAYRDPATGLAVRCVAVVYAGFPVVEWTLHFKNEGAADTPILEEIQALDTTLERYRWPPSARIEFALHHFTGSPCTPGDYAPHRTVLGPGTETRITASGGRPTNSDLCYFNVEWPSEGVIIGIGWPGQWAARFTRDAGTRLRVRVGQERTRFKLEPGEEVRSPLVALLCWKGDWIRGQNLWRRWMIAHNLPRAGGKLPPCPHFAACSSHQFGEMIGANEANQILFVDRYLEEGLRIDTWWMDAGWYVNRTGWPNTGTWEVDRWRFPRGLGAIADHAHARGVNSLVWFEPERVTPGTWLYRRHPEWLLGPDGGTKLLNLGLPEARRWLTDHVDRLITEEGIDIYRNDFNIDPLAFWRADDAGDRQGITEIRYVTGYLAYWDALRARHPTLRIDSCASGGRRNDLETLRRAVPLLRSDYLFDPVAQQGHTYGIAFWIPYFGTGIRSGDPYLFRSAMCPHNTGCWDLRRKDLPYDAIRRLVAQWKRIAPFFLGDYYPLTPYSLAHDVWIAWQFNRPERRDGVVQAFRRSGSIYESARLPLRDLDPDARYRIEDLDEGPRGEASGRGLMEEGLRVRIPDRPGAVVLLYGAGG